MSEMFHALVSTTTPTQNRRAAARRLRYQLAIKGRSKRRMKFDGKQTETRWIEPLAE